MTLDYDIREIPLDQLSDHPLQHAIYDETSHAELEELAADLKRRGQQEPIHISTQCTILRGHRRTAAAKLNGWQTIKAIIRHDLPDPMSFEAVDDLISDNLQRRQLDDLALARCYSKLKSHFDRDQLGDGETVRDVLATKLNCRKSGRTLERLLQLLKLPRDIQCMISDGRLNKSHGAKVLKLSPARREAVIQELRTRTDVVRVLREHQIVKPRHEKTTFELGEDLLRFYKANLPTLAKGLESLDRLQVRGHDVVALLDDATEFMIALRDRKRMLARQS